jgi:hypothetical protein
LPLAHQFSPLTKTSNHSRNRGNISILSIVWLAVASVSCTVIVEATLRVQLRAQLQASADAVVLAYASRNEEAAHTMARFLGVVISSAELSANMVAITVKTSAGTASAQALRSAYEFQS